MTPLIYSQTREDFYFKQLNKSEYEEQIKQLTSKKPFLGFSENLGLIHFSFIGKVIQVVKGLFGWTDCTYSVRLNAECLKFLYYGEVRGFLKEDTLYLLKKRFNKLDSAHPSILKLFKKIESQHISPSPNRLAHMRAILIEYHHQNANYLQPCLWSRLLHKPDIEKQQLVHFGDFPLLMAQKALSQPQKEIQKAFHYFLEAFHLNNSDPVFQRKFALQFKYFVESYAQDPVITGQRSLIHQIMLGLADNAYQNGCIAEAHEYLIGITQNNPTDEMRNQIGMLALTNKDLVYLGPFLPSLQRAYANQPSIQTQIAEAYWQNGHYAEGIAAKQTAIQLYLAQSGSQLQGQNNHFKQASALYAQIGQAYLERFEGLRVNNSLNQAIMNLDKAFFYDPEQLDYQRQLILAYIQQWQESPQNFFEQHGIQWLQFLKKGRHDILREQSSQLERMLLDAIKQLFDARRNPEGDELLNIGIQLFGNRADFVLEILMISTQNDDLTIVQHHLTDWTILHDQDPFIQARIGDLYWEGNKPLAINLYHRAIELFQQKRQNSLLHERHEYDLQLSELQNKLGQDQLRNRPPGSRGSVHYDQAISRLEEAAQLDPSVNNQPLYEGYLTAALVEKAKDLLSINWEKIIIYYSKAFALNLQNAPYLLELMHLYLSNSNCKTEAMALYTTISRQPWASQFHLSAEQFHNLGQLFLDKNQKVLSLQCFAKAYELKPLVRPFKLHYFHARLNSYLDKEKQICLLGNFDEKANQLLQLANSLKDDLNTEFMAAEEIKILYRKTLSQIYCLLAELHERKFYFDKPVDCNQLIKEQREKFAFDIQQTLNYYDKALSYTEDDSILHFKKGMVFAFQSKLDKAKEAFRQAVKYNKANLFYCNQLALLYGTLGKVDKQEKYQNKIGEKLDSLLPSSTYQTWSKEYFFKEKTLIIDPHSSQWCL